MGTRKRQGDSYTKSTSQEPEGTPDAEQTEAVGGIPARRLVLRFLVVVGSIFALNLYSRWTGDTCLARSTETVEYRKATVPCSRDYDRESHLKECLPKRCGRVVTDKVVDKQEAEILLRMAKAGLALGGSNGGASILDIHSGALSKGSQFINIYKIIEDTGKQIFTKTDFQLYNKVKNKIHRTIAREFGVRENKLYLTSPTFFSRMNTKPAQTIHDEYWHVHVDKETYGSFHYTSLLYLTDYGTDFKGGRFIFTDDGRNTTVEPKLGRVSFFTSGSENPHYVERVLSGTRYAITVSFTCDPEKAISDPGLY